MGNLIHFQRKYKISKHKPAIYVVCDTEGNPVAYRPIVYSAWKKPKLMYYRAGDATRAAENLNDIMKEEQFKVVKFIPEETK